MNIERADDISAVAAISADDVSSSQAGSQTKSPVTVDILTDDTTDTVTATPTRAGVTVTAGEVSAVRRPQCRTAVSNDTDQTSPEIDDMISPTTKVCTPGGAVA